MWIRSQNRKSLTDCDSFAVERFFEQYQVVTLSSRSGISVALGIYSSEEKALRVLDEIQAIVESKQFCVVDNVDLGNYVLHNGVQVYQMPQDEEDFKWDQ